MAEATKLTKEGIGLGIAAGVLFAAAEAAAARLVGPSALAPLRAAASLVMGTAALETAGAGTAFAVGMLVHLALSAFYGLTYGLFHDRLPAEMQAATATQAGLGMLFGVLLWLTNFQILARIFVPWFLDRPQLLQLVLHALSFGLPLGLLYAAAQRRAHRPRSPRPA